MKKNIFKNSSRKTLSLFTTAGFPKLDSLVGQLELFERHGVDFVEVGIPFSDPMADGPVIQNSSMKALQNGMNLNILFEQLNQRRSTLPLVLMGYINPLLQFGLEKFLTKAQKAGVSGLVLPDLSAELYEKRYQMIFERYNIPVCFLVTPLTDDERIQRAAKFSHDGFLYLVSSNSTTGGIGSDYNSLQERYQTIKQLAGETPVIIGFGIRDRESFERATLHVDGGIIGSALIQAIEKNKEEDFIVEIR